MVPRTSESRRANNLNAGPLVAFDVDYSPTETFRVVQHTSTGYCKVEVGEIRHKTAIGAWDGSFASGLDPARKDYASFASFSDPDGQPIPSVTPESPPGQLG